MNEIEVSGFNIHDYADPSVGIFETDWELRGDMIFDSKEDLAKFKGELVKLFNEYFAQGRISVQTFEEIKKLNEI